MMHCAAREVNIPLQSQQIQPMMTHAEMTFTPNAYTSMDSLTVAQEKETHVEMTWNYRNAPLPE